MNMIKWSPIKTTIDPKCNTIIVGKPGNGVAFHREIVKIGYYNYLVEVSHNDKILPRIIKRITDL
ncbi:MAG: hypothetical protein K6B64_02355 [Acholeplasmatales bacterium]|nr:hypothetical protein [Acholeplasmatales bacterium]